jgi:peptidoglycan hydrolase FlgJ
MNVPALNSRVSAADIPPERLAGNTSLTEAQKIAEASRQFEAILLRQILSETQKTAIPSKYTDNSVASGIYRDMVTNQLADSISKSGSFGLAKTFERQLTSKPAASALKPQASTFHS